jgi:hypothetical protein
VNDAHGSGWSGPSPVGLTTALFAYHGSDGRLHTGLCYSTTPEQLRAAAEAERQGRSCRRPHPRIASLMAFSARQRRLTLRIRLEHGRERAPTVQVRWGHFVGIPGVPTTERRVPPGRILRMTHRYPRRGQVLVQVTAFAATHPLCHGGGSAHRQLLVRVR